MRNKSLSPSIVISMMTIGNIRTCVTTIPLLVALLLLAPPASSGSSGVLEYYLSDSRASNVNTRAVFRYGNSPMIPIVGDWDGDGKDTVSAYDPTTATFYISNDPITGVAQYTFRYGNPNDIPFVGDWDGDGKDEVGVMRGNVFYMRTSPVTSAVETTVWLAYGNPGWKPVVGDWDGDGKDTLSAYDPSTGKFYISNNPATGLAQYVVPYGNPNAVPLVGDWNGDGKDDIGVRMGNVFCFRISPVTSSVETTESVAYGDTSDMPVIGDWDGDHKASQGVARFVGAATPTPPPPPSPPLQNVKVMQWNIAGGTTNAGFTDIVKVLLKRIDDYKPDIVSLNEVCKSQADAIGVELRSRTGWDYHFFNAPQGISSCSKWGGEGPEGIMLLSRVPTSDIKGHLFRDAVFPAEVTYNPFDDYRAALCLTAQFSMPVRVCTMHLSGKNPPTLPLSQAKAFFNYFRDDIKKRHYLVIGDFNLDPTNADFRNLMYAPVQKGNGFFYEVDYGARGCSENKDSIGCFTYPSTGPNRKIDFVFGSINGFGRETSATVFRGDAERCRPFYGVPDRPCSDHNGLVGTLPLYPLNDLAGAEGPYWYASVGATQSMQVIDIDGPSEANGRAAQLWSWSGASNQRWYVKAVPAGLAGGAGGGSGASKLINMYSNKCLDVQGPSASPGAAVHQWDCYDTRSQVWIREPMGQRCDTAKGCVDTFRLRNYYAEYLTGRPMCLDAKNFGTSNGTRLQIWSCNANSNQLWYGEH